jgi:ketosteroid isomerase-like protein
VSREDFEVVRAAWEVANRGRLDDFLDLLHPDVEVIPFGAAMEGRSYRGRAAVRNWREHELDAVWEMFEIHAEDFEDVGDRLVVFGYWVARGRASGVELQRSATWVVDVRDGRIARWQTYTDRDEALRDAAAR